MKCYKCGYENEEGNLFCIKCGNKIEYDPEFELNEKYTAAVKAMDSAVSADDFSYAKNLFKDINEYIDSADKMAECEEKAKELHIEQTYSNAVRIMDSAGSQKDYITAKNLFESIIDYKDSVEKAEECNKKSEAAHYEDIYSNALNARDSDDPDAIERAIKQLKTIPEYKNSEQLIEECEKNLSSAIEKLKNKEEKRQKEAQLQKKRHKIRLIAGISSVAAIAIIGICLKNYYDKVYIPQKEYESAKAVYESAVQMYQSGDYFQAVDLLRKSSLYTEGDLTVSDIIQPKHRLAAGKFHLVALYDNNTVLSEGGSAFSQKALKEWTDVVSVSAGSNSTIGITADGHILSIGKFESISAELTDVIAADIYDDNLSVIHSDGTAEYCMDSDRFEKLDGNFAAVAAGNNFSVFLNTDGTAKFVLGGERVDYSVCDVSDWHDLYSIDAADDYTLGLKTDGTVLISGGSEEIRSQVSEWTDISAIVAGNEFAAGIKRDGTVVTTKLMISEDIAESDQFNNIAEIAVTNDCLWALTSDNKLIFDDTNYYKSYSIIDTWENDGIDEVELFKANFQYESKGNKLSILKYIGNETSVIIPENIQDKNVEVISEGAFANTNIEAVILPDSLKRIEGDAFKNCSNLKSIDLSGLRQCEIYSDAFSYSGLNDIYFPDDTSLISNTAFENTPWKENALIYDISETHDLDINDIMTYPFERIGRVYKFEAHIQDIFPDSEDDDLIECLILANDAQGYERMAVSVDKHQFEYFENIDCRNKNTVVFYGLFTGKTANVRNYEWNTPITVPYLSVVKIDGTENLKFVDQRNYNGSGLDVLIEQIESTGEGLSWIDDDYNFIESWHSINMNVQEVSEPYYEGYSDQYDISGMVGNSKVTIRICETESHSIAMSLIDSQCTFKCLLVYGQYARNTPNADYEFLFQSDSLEEALS